VTATAQGERRAASFWPWLLALAMHCVLANALWIWAGFGIGLALILPLAAALPGLLRQHRYTAGWLTLLLCFYIAGLMSEGFSQPQRKLIALSLSAVATIEFVSLVLFVRLASREQAAAAAALAARTGSSADA
jgi:uncharacterized membrane protein